MAGIGLAIFDRLSEFVAAETPETDIVSEDCWMQEMANYMANRQRVGDARRILSGKGKKENEDPKEKIIGSRIYEKNRRRS